MSGEICPYDSEWPVRFERLARRSVGRSARSPSVWTYCVTANGSHWPPEPSARPLTDVSWPAGDLRLFLRTDVNCRPVGYPPLAG